MKTVVIGHKNPDTDSICSAIAYAELKTRKGNEGVIAGRAGTINQQTEFVLSYFKQESPPFFSDVYPRLSDIMNGSPVTVSHGTPVLDVMRKFRDEKVRFLPVTDDVGKVHGTFGTLDLAEQFTSHTEPKIARKVYTTPDNVASATDSTILVETTKKRERDFSVFVGAMSEESFVRTISGYDPSNLIIIAGDRMNILQAALKNGVALLIVTGGLTVSPDIIKEAKKQGTAVMVTPHDSASAAWLVKLSAPAGRFSSNTFTTASLNDRVESIRKSFLSSPQRGIVVTDENNILQGVVTKSNFFQSAKTRLILMDHNEFSQTVDGADQVEIIEVVDHHRVADFHTAMPISMTIQPVGSTCTLVAEKYKEGSHDLSRKIAGLLLSGIISDTVSGRSPTTTSRDREMLSWLEVISEVKGEQFSIEMFSASSILGQKPPREVILNDFKEFVIGGQKLGIGQVEVVGFERFHRAKEELMEELWALKQEKEYALVGLMVTDITYEVTLFPVAADYDICAVIGLQEIQKNIFEMKDVLSRKKQVVPHLYNVLGR